MKTPWMKWFPADWRSDPKLRACSPLSRYVWMEMLGLMHEAEPYGHLLLNGRPIQNETLSRLIGVEMRELAGCVRELDRQGVFSRTDVGVIYSRRMIRDREAQERQAKFGKLGGDPDLKALASIPKEARGKRINRANNPTLVKAIWEKCEGRCSVCGEEMNFEHKHRPNDFEIDHIIPVCSGGTNEPNNLRGVCKSCNLKLAKERGRSNKINGLLGSNQGSTNPASSPHIPDTRYQIHDMNPLVEEPREGARAAQPTLKLVAEAIAFPASGSIAYVEPWLSLSRKYSNGKDPDYVAGKFRPWCVGRGIAFDDPKISEIYVGFCKSDYPLKAG